ncbi:hypothetical protein, partial [Pectinatus frisingensis]|uniref:hypothetical protein n=1 Tax=Pectinatus frisingensis TaxID=865 RepID=UPI0018C83856
NLLRKRIQLLEESTKQSNTVKTTSVHTLLSGSNDNTPIIDADTNSAIMALLGKSSSTDKTAVAECNYDDDNLKALSDYLNSTDKPIIDVTANGQKPTEEVITFVKKIGEKTVLLRYDKSALSAGGLDLDFTANGIDAKALINLAGKEAAENSMIDSINHVFKELGSRMSEFKAMESTGHMGAGTAAADLNICLDGIARNINSYNKSYDDKSVFDVVIDSLQSVKQSLFNDTKAQNDPQKMTIVGTTKLIDYITDMF